MNLDFFSNDLQEIFKKIDLQNVYEIRLRLGFPILIKTSDKNFYICKRGLTLLKSESINCSVYHIEKIIENITERSFYAYNNQIKQGFLSTRDGIRVGIAGDCVFEKGEIITIKNITSINVRIPHDIKGCSNDVFKYVYDGDIYNTLIISPPSKGKTTLLKDIIEKINALNTFSILVIDERGEFSLKQAENVDIIRFSDKLFAFNYGIRTMSPNVIITDELCSINDYKCALYAVNSAVKIIASAHGNSFLSIKNKDYFINGIFDRYVVLKDGENPGIIDSVFDRDFNII